MSRLERRLFRLADEIAHVSEELRQAEEELFVLMHLDDDAQRDAAVSDHPIDRDDARETAADVARFRRLVAHLTGKRDDLESKRQRLLLRLG